MKCTQFGTFTREEVIEGNHKFAKAQFDLKTGKTYALCKRCLAKATVTLIGQNEKGIIMGVKIVRTCSDEY